MFIEQPSPLEGLKQNLSYLEASRNENTAELIRTTGQLRKLQAVSLSIERQAAELEEAIKILEDHAREKANNASADAKTD